jgi:hypothetical protein
MALEMTRTDLEYFRHRAAVEREMADKSVSPKVAAVHQKLARQYDALVNEPEQPQPPLRAV